MRKQEAGSRKQGYQATIGLEIHAELATGSKMFCGSDNYSPPGTSPNLHICEICVGEPGVLPVLNHRAVAEAIKVGLALGCKVAKKTRWDRKHYFYPDLPKGYQISQYDEPLTFGGVMTIVGEKRKSKKVRITRLHLEEDTGKLTHPAGRPYSLVDFNRAGTPLIELVTEPDMTSAHQAKRFAVEFQRILRALGVSNVDMEKGEMRVEANVSVSRLTGPAAAVSRRAPIRPRGGSPPSRHPSTLGTKVEIKNLNSFRAVERAIDYEIGRQTEVLEEGGEVTQETRGWDEAKGKTFSQRTKEVAEDYRYFAEPDLPEVEIGRSWLAAIKSGIDHSVLPAERRKKLMNLKLREDQVEMLLDLPRLANLFEEALTALPKASAGKVAGLIFTEIVGFANSANKSPEDYKFNTREFNRLARDFVSGKISSRLVKEIIGDFFEKGTPYDQLLKGRDLAKIGDQKLLAEVVQEVMAENRKVVDQFRAGKAATFEFLMGRVMAKTRGQADPALSRTILKDKLSKR